MSKEIEKVAKQPKTIEIKVLTPWAIIVLIAAISAGFMAGFHYNQQIEHDVANRAQVLAETLKTQK